MPGEFYIFLVEMGFFHIGQAGLKLLTSGDPPASASQSARIRDVSHHAWPRSVFIVGFFFLPIPSPLFLYVLTCYYISPT